MLPTLSNGDWLLFVRQMVKVGDIVLADFDEDGYLVKRIMRIVPALEPAYGDYIAVLTGDNTEITGTYRIWPQDILGVMVCRLWRAR